MPFLLFFHLSVLLANRVLGNVKAGRRDIGSGAVLVGTVQFDGATDASQAQLWLLSMRQPRHNFRVGDLFAPKSSGSGARSGGKAFDVVVEESVGA
jgi:hypothetical protein